MTTGFYLMHRGWQENPVFDNAEFSRRDAWIWMIENACYRDTRVGIKGKSVDLKRGQLSFSTRFLATKWRWSEAGVRRFITRLQTDAMIDAASDAGQMVVTICNYDTYQTSIEATDAASDAEVDAAATQERRSSDAKKKEVNKENNRDSISSDPILVLVGEPQKVDVAKTNLTAEFAAWYAQYPRREDKIAAEKAYRTARKKASAADLLGGAMAYAAECDRAGRERRYIKLPASWLNAGSWTNEPQPSTGNHNDDISRQQSGNGRRTSAHKTMFAAFGAVAGSGETGES
jgi:hypothetical protein